MKLNNVKKILSIVFTVLLVIVLFAIIAVKVGWVKPDAQFYSELGLITLITIQVKFFWFGWGEEKTLESEDIINAKQAYDDNATRIVTDINDFEIKLKELDKLNVENYISNKLRNRTKENYVGKICFFFKKDFNKLYNRIRKQALKKVKKLNSSEILTRCEAKQLYDSKNRFKSRKYMHQGLTTVMSIISSIVFASIAYEGIKTNPEIWFRYISYLFVISYTILTTIISASRITRNEVLDYLARLENILFKYDNMKKGGVSYVNNSEREITSSGTIQRL